MPKQYTTTSDGDNIALGAKADSVATTDTGTFSLIALFKRWLQRGASSTATRSNVSGSASDVQLLASDSTRKGAMFFNDSTAALYLGLSATTTSTTSFTVLVPAQGYYELPVSPVFTGEIRGIWSAANGAVRITVLT